MLIKIIYFLLFYEKKKYINEDSKNKFLTKKNKNKYNKTKTLFSYLRSTSICIFILIFIFIFVIAIVLYFKKKKKIKNDNKNLKYEKVDIIDKIDSQEFNKIKEFIDININGQFVNSTSYTENNLTNISIIIPVYNGYSSLRKAILSIQNQDFNNFEIIIIDDKSTDNSVSLVKELIEKDRRINLYQNEENKGIFFSKFNGISNAKGTYVMILNQNDFYTQMNCFSTLFDMAETNKIEAIGFASLIGKSTKIQSKNLTINHYIETPILYQPDILKEMYKDNLNGTFVKDINSISNYFFRKELLNDVQKFIQNILEKKINYHNNFLLYFLMSRNTYNLKHIKNIFHFRLLNQDNNPNGIDKDNEKIKEKENLKCNSSLYYSQFLLQNTINIKTDRKLASFEINNF